MLLLLSFILLSFPVGEPTVRGFLYQTQEGSWIVSQEPNLKTCCVGAAHKADSQIEVEGTFPESAINKAVTLKGDWVVQGESYRLVGAEIVAEEKSSWLFLGLCAIGIIAIPFLKRRDAKTKEAQRRRQGLGT